MAGDLALARALQAQFDAEEAHKEMMNFLPQEFRFASPAKRRKIEADLCIVDPEWEDLDPTPDLHSLFLEFNKTFFWNKLLSCEVKWSPQMTTCAGICSYRRREGYCSIRLSVPLLKLRPRKDLVETLLHEMIHAYLFVTHGDVDRDGHGPAFHEHMFRINKEAGTKISVYHSFHDEVALYKQHWWKCNGPCQKRHPFYGTVKRAKNRAPGPNDLWWKEHQMNCGGTFTKIKEPEGYGQKKSKGKAPKSASAPPAVTPKGQKDIRSFVDNASGTSKKPTPGAGAAGNIFGFGGPSFSAPSGSGLALQTKGRSGTMVVGANSRMADNSSGGQVLSQSSSGISQIIRTTGNETPQVSVQQKLRDLWGNKFKSDVSASSSAPPTDHPQTKSSKEPKGVLLAKNEPTSNCPVCGKEILQKDVNEHLDDCLQTTDSEETIQSQTSRNPFVEDEDFKKCPVCQKEVLNDEMNEHLDYCIEANN